MKLVDHFDEFMTQEVNLNSTRVTQLEDSIGAIKDTLRASSWEPKIRSFIAQGSWALQRGRTLDRRRVEFFGSLAMAGWLRHRDSAT